MNGTTVNGPVRATFREAEQDLKRLAQPNARALTASLTLGDWLVTYRDEHSHRLAAATYDLNESYRVRHLLGHPIYRTALSRLTLPMLQAWVDGLHRHEPVTAGGPYVPTGSLAPASVHRVAAYLRRALTVARQHGHLDTNPMEGVLLPATRRRQNRVLHPDELRQLLVVGDRTACMIVVLVLTGMRRGELARLEWHHVQGERLLVPGTKNAASLAPVPLAELARLAIDAQPRRSSFVFTTESGRPLSPRNITRDIRARLRAHGVPDSVRLHDLRGTYVSLLVESGADIATVMAMARHASVRTTLGVYAQSRAAVQQAALQGMLNLVGSQDRDPGAESPAPGSLSD